MQTRNAKRKALSMALKLALDKDAAKNDPEKRSADAEGMEVEPVAMVTDTEQNASNLKRKRKHRNDSDGHYAPTAKKIKTTAKAENNSDSDEDKMIVSCDIEENEENEENTGQVLGVPPPTFANLQIKLDPPATLETDLKRLGDFFPQCDSEVIRTKLEAKKHRVSRVQEVAGELEEEFDLHPKYEGQDFTNPRDFLLNKLLDIDAQFEDFVQCYENLNTEFNDFTKAVSENYKLHMKAQLAFDFPRIRRSYINKVANAKCYLYLPTYKEILQIPQNARGLCLNARKYSNFMPDYPEELDSTFFKELLFRKHEARIRCQVKTLKEERKARFKELKSKGLLASCRCCCDEEIIPDDLIACPDNHQFCKTCVKQSAEVMAGQARGKVPCLEHGCKTYYTLHAVQKCVTAKTFSFLLSTFQHEELQSAHLEGLFTCNACNYAAIMEDGDEMTIFKCLNPLCMKETCRICGEENHLPLTCDELKESKEVYLRKGIEDEMSGALIRECYKCSRRFIRTDGCPNMICVCGAVSCYICRKVRKRRSRYCGCKNVDTEILHKKEVTEAYWRARGVFLNDQKVSEEFDNKYKIDKLLEIATGPEQPQITVQGQL